MADNHYNIDDLLAELRAKRTAIENNTQAQSSASAAEAEQPQAAQQTETASKAEEIRRALEGAAEMEQFGELPPQQEQPAGQDTLPAPADDVQEEPRRNVLRSIREQLTGDFAPVGFAIGHPAEPDDADDYQTEEQHLRAEAAQNHPVFTAQATATYVIPADKPKAVSSDSGQTVSFSTVELDLPQKEKGILNVRENADESFREFFGDTVLVEHEDRRSVRRAKETSVFEDDEPEHPEEYRSEEDTEDILADLLFARGRALGRIVAGGILAAALAVTALLASSAFMQLAPALYYAINAVLLLICILLNAKTVFGGTAKLFALRADASSLCGFSALMGLVQCAVLLVSGEQPQPLTGFVCALALTVCAAGDWMDASRTLRNFRSIAENPKKYASLVLADQDFTRMLTHDLHVGEANVLIKRRTGFTDNFLAHASSTNVRFDRLRKLQPAAVLLSLLLGVFTVLRGGSFAQGVSAAAVCAAMCAPFAAGVVSALPIFKLQKRLTRMGAVLPGYSAAEELADANCVVIEGRELFPRDKVLLHGIKTFDRERVDRAILYAASVLIHSCDTMSHMFMKVIQGKTDMLFEADSVVYEEGLGFSFWVEQNRILVGRRELLEAHEIEVPSRDYENRYTKTSTRDAIYLAVAGKLYAMFVISYAPDEEMGAMLQELVKQNINIIVRTRDFIISPDKIARMYDIPRSMITLVRDSSMQELAKKTEYTHRCSSSLTHIGSASCLLQGTVGSRRMLSAASGSSLLTLCSMLLGAAISLVLALVGALPGASVLSVAAFQLLWLAIHVLSVWLRKY